MRTAQRRGHESPSVIHGALGANLGQFALLIGVNGLVGALAGQERTLIPLLGERVFGVSTATAATAFLVTFGVAKAAANLVAGRLADRVGRKKVLVGGWVLGFPVPLLLMWAPSWEWVIGANALLGVNQGLTWSSTVVMKMDLAGPAARGLAMALNEFSGYLALALSAAATGYLASLWGLRPEPLFLGVALAGLGLGISLVAVRETLSHARREGRGAAARSLGDVALDVSLRNRSLAAISRTGLVNNANDAFAWALIPLIMAGQSHGPGAIGLVAGAYPAVWSIGQLATGPLSDRVGRRRPIVAGMFVQAIALGSMLWIESLSAWIAAAVVLGVGTALVYPVLLAAVGDGTDPNSRATAIGVYRTWRDSGYVIGALLTGGLADLFGLDAGIAAIALLTAGAGVDAARGLIHSSSEHLKR